MTENKSVQLNSVEFNLQLVVFIQCQITASPQGALYYKVKTIMEKVKQKHIRTTDFKVKQEMITAIQIKN